MITELTEFPRSADPVLKYIRIMVVEDERIIARDLQVIPQQAGYQVPAMAASGEEAIAMADKFNPDLTSWASASSLPIREPSRAATSCLP